VDVYGYTNIIEVEQIASIASNLRGGSNESFTINDFLSIYPQFGSTTNNPPVPNISTAIIQLYIDLADVSLSQARWRGAWKIAMSLFVAHFCAIYMKEVVSVNAGKDAIVAAAKMQGIIVSESADSLSYSMDIASIANDLEGFAMWKSTEFGAQLVTLSKIYSLGGMVIR